ncbi:ABC transporter ATP-binding protein [Proteiniclasticum ruminis]|uniref:Iron(III) transport system ATP-binding protein n=2 Tax=Proteiniclasticum ruminis TaxID=398199 RepID=A0A1G8K2P3_9CLOT|nr:ABC transporter ATP-binding protein [Proteiniclasticum ruminis]SDI37070.1 iron(III) transport system ATP-binding protein [Proteiniclasticum ruminis]
MSYAVHFKEIDKYYGDFHAVKNANFTVKEGEFFTLLGPSGCGKTTLLRMIAGFNSIEGGTISFGDKVINKIPAHKRNIGMVFQNYAIFPHMTVFNNVAYGLKARNIGKKEAEERVLKALRLVRMEEYKDREPSKLSGGQQQRIALARAIVIEPDVLLMDEPLSNLDAKLRLEMRTIIKKLQRELGITTIYVTHDQEEALAISDRIAVMKLGVIQQIDVPENIYKSPANAFVAGFIGTSNFLKGEAVKENGKVYLHTHGAKLSYDRDLAYEGPVTLSLRPEEGVLTKNLGEEGLRGTITLSTFLGDFMNYEITLTDGTIMEVNEYTKDGKTLREIGEEVVVKADASVLKVYNEEGQVM